VETLEKVVPSDRIMYLFFEEMVSRDNVVEIMRSVEKFLGLSSMESSKLLSMTEVRKNVSESVEFRKEQIEKVREVLDDVYNFVGERFSRLPEDWAC
jgi:ABC-type taurine transport system substrate-binding protein